MLRMPDESILVVRRRDFFDGDWPQGFVPCGTPGLPSLAAVEAAGHYVARSRAEQDPQLKQPIPYCMVLREGLVLCVRRKQAGTESRLHGLRSVGLGGHVHPADSGTGRSQLLAALDRELREELHIPPTAGLAPRLLGWINDDSNPVGQVHVGLGFVLDVTGEPWGSALSVRETSKLAGGFEHLVGLPKLWQDPARFETWSTILLAAWAGLPGHPGHRMGSSQNQQE